MRRWYKIYANHILRPYLQWKLRKPVTYRGYGLTIRIPSGVFHPKYYHSTTYLLEFLKNQHLSGTTFLELGCGSGLISLCAAKEGAHVTAVDIHPTAVEALRENAQVNSLELEVLASDMFGQLSNRQFDIIAINPPYYPKDPANHAEMAWFCGVHFEYFENFFSEFPKHLSKRGIGWMVLSEDCDLGQIAEIAERHRVRMEEHCRQSFLGEYQIIYSLQV
jgi:release factor glutamine methyltransferase